MARERDARGVKRFLVDRAGGNGIDVSGKGCIDGGGEVLVSSGTICVGDETGQDIASAGFGHDMDDVAGVGLRPTERGGHVHQHAEIAKHDGISCALKQQIGILAFYCPTLSQLFLDRGMGSTCSGMELAHLSRVCAEV